MRGIAAKQKPGDYFSPVVRATNSGNQRIPSLHDDVTPGPVSTMAVSVPPFPPRLVYAKCKPGASAVQFKKRKRKAMALHPLRRHFTHFFFSPPYQVPGSSPFAFSIHFSSFISSVRLFLPIHHTVAWVRVTAMDITSNQFSPCTRGTG